MEKVDLQKILDKAQKLKTLSERAGTPEEAANAASKLQGMLLRYNLTLQAVEENVQPEYNKEDFELNENRNHKGWAASLYHGIGKANQCETIFFPGTAKMSIVGRKHNIEMVNYLYGYLINQIKGLAERATAGQYEGQARYRRAFCIGAVSTVRKRLREEVDAVVSEQPSYGALVSTEKALVLKEFKTQFPRTRKGSGSSYSSGSGFSDGREAGKGIGIRGGIGTSVRGVALLG
jgi:hypothetical protein